MNKIKFKWTNIFIRDFLLAVVIVVVNYRVNFNSWFAACAAGMLIVLTTWHLSDLIKLKRRLNYGLYRFNGNSGSSIGDIPNNIQQNQESGFKGLFGGN